MDDDLALALALADSAAAISLPRFLTRSFTVSIKPDGSRVTDGDVAVERALRARLACDRPGDAIVGEELGTSNGVGDGDASRTWYLDPIDGTDRFVRCDPRWLTLIALARGGRLEVGVADLPGVGERWWATSGVGAWRRRRGADDDTAARLAVSRHATLDQAVVADTWREDLRRGNQAHPLHTVAQRAAQIHPHLGHNFLAVAAGEVDIAVSPRGSVWDYAPLKVIVEAAGGRFSDFDGADRIDSGNAVATNGLLHNQVLALLPH